MRIILAMVLIGGFLLFLGVQEMRLSSIAKPEPQVITCANLEANGAGDNAHVTISDFLMCDFGYVYEQNEGSSTFTKIWVPVVPLEGEYFDSVVKLIEEQGDDVELPMPKKIKIVVKSSKVKNEADLGRLAEGDTITGLIVNNISSLGSEERKILEGSYPGVNFDDVLIFEHERQPASTGKMAGFLGGGGLLVVGGIGVGLLMLAKSRGESA